MDSLKHKKDKVKFLKGLLSGELSLKQELTPKVYTVYSLDSEQATQYTKGGEVLTEVEKEQLIKQAGSRPVIWVNIVYTETNRVFSLPYNHRGPIAEPIYKTFNSNHHIKP
jgi:hypothetical protein